MTFPLLRILRSPVYQYWSMYFSRTYKDSIEFITPSLTHRDEDLNISERSKNFRARFLNQIKTIEHAIPHSVTKHGVLHTSRDHYFTKLLTDDSSDVKDHEQVLDLPFLKRYLQQLVYSFEYPGKLQYNKEAIEAMDNDTILSLLSHTNKLRFEMNKWSLEIRREKKTARQKQLPHDFNNHVKNTFVPRINKREFLRHMRWKMLSGVPQDFPIILDMQFDKAMSSNSHRNLIAQLMCLCSYNMLQSHPVPLLFCNFKRSSDSYKSLESMKFLDASEDYVTYTSSSFKNLKGIDTDDLVYLSPDASTSLQKFCHDKVYIIGGLVDKSFRSRLTVSLAQRAGVSSLKFPLSDYLIWGNKGGRMELSLDIVFKILLTLRDTDSWPAALKHIPRRFHRGLKNPSLVEHNKELKKWYEVAEAKAVQNEVDDSFHDHEARVQGYFGIQRHPRARHSFKSSQTDLRLFSGDFVDESD